jgi:hypothetical protein
MPGPGAIITLGAVGAAGAAVYVNRRNSMTSTESESPIALARRKSSSVQLDHDWHARKQPEYIWRRDNGVNFSHNSKPKFPSGKQPEQSSK